MAFATLDPLAKQSEFTRLDDQYGGARVRVPARKAAVGLRVLHRDDVVALSLMDTKTTDRSGRGRSARGKSASGVRACYSDHAHLQPRGREPTSVALFPNITAS